MAESRMTAVAACRACGNELREDARFCPACGSPVAGASAQAEYKQVTVLFADVVHSMDIAAAVGAALAEGMAPADIGEAITLAANQLILRDAGRTPAMETNNKPIGSAL